VGSTTTRRHGAEFLAELLDFKGAVELARALDTATTASRPCATTTTEELGQARQHVEAAEREARRALDDRPSDPLVPAARVDAVLRRALTRAPRHRAMVGAVRELFVPVETRTLQRIVSVRRLIRDARSALALAIAAGGSTAGRLGQIDAALTAATAARSDALVARAVGALGESFASDVERAMLAQASPSRATVTLPTEETPSDVALAAVAIATDYVARCETFVVATYLHERSRLDMLVSAALGERL